MINFEKEFGHWYDYTKASITDYPIHHRIEKSNHWRIIPICSHEEAWLADDQIIKYENICKECLETYTEKEIADLKQYLIVKKLKS